MPDIFPSLRPRLVVSIVSHAHGELVQGLLLQLAQWSAHSVTRVVLVQNVVEPVPQPPLSGWPFKFDVVVNEVPRGFGANHNRALGGAAEDFLCVLNPDVKLLAQDDPFDDLIAACAVQTAGCAYPTQIDEQGHIQDSEREVPTPLSLIRRRLLGRRETRVDWVNAACLVVPTSVWRDLGGFDERYFMYCEDVDFCLRLRLHGLLLVKAPARIVHAGQRASGRSVRHFAWHVRSLVRLWLSPVYGRAQQLLTSSSASAGTIGTP
jgi:N-acetylglucosaminyl-diphospho-decaprenol L-rhamnosyltransferase